MFFFNNRVRYFDIEQKSDIDERLANQAPGGGTNMTAALTKALEHANELYHDRDVTIFVISDGIPNSRTGVENVIKEHVATLESEQQLGITFVHIGTNANAKAWLEKLDDDFTGAARDVIDFKSYTDDIQATVCSL
eukprot:TRINITY_DN310_c0_g1_i2.p1 TRINITY_DN310_c0_g1~~TRINITY_DN310_c0_g1_i2.p1  ORF type:complete len:136 (-),score=31.13 TRINITY_DN310_c0_g1_i2:209-616(-)